MRNFFVLPFHLTKFIPTHLLSKKFLGVRITLEHLIFFLVVTYTTKYLTFHYQYIRISH